MAGHDPAFLIEAGEFAGSWSYIGQPFVKGSGFRANIAMMLDFGLPRQSTSDGFSIHAGSSAVVCRQHSRHICNS